MLLKNIRIIFQSFFLIFCIYIGYKFYHYYQWATGKSDFYVPKPPSVEAFLPIGSLVSLKKLALTGAYDSVHPAGLSLFIAFILLCFLMRKAFCGWICPVGAVSNFVQKIGSKLGILKELPKWAHYPLMSIKYLLLGFFLYMILISMNLYAMEAFIQSPYNMTVDGRMLKFFLKPSAITICVLIFLIAISFFIRNFWCRYLCPYGAFLGLIALASLLSIRRDETKCINCKKCEKICPASLKIYEKDKINSPECQGCFDCIKVCPAKDCLSMSCVNKIDIKSIRVFAGMVLIFIISAWLIAVFAGKWESPIKPEVFRTYYMMLEDKDLR